MRSFQVLFIVLSLFLIAQAQVYPGFSTDAVANCASINGGIGAITYQCTACNSGFYLTGQASTCNITCAVGCSLCFNATYCLSGGCQPGFVMNTANNTCVDCTGLNPAPVIATGTSLGCIVCTLKPNAVQNVVNCTICANGYAVSYYPGQGGYCFSCSNATRQFGFVPASNFTGIAGCASCVTNGVLGAGLATLSNATGTGVAPTTQVPAYATNATNPYVQCTACAIGYALLGKMNSLYVQANTTFPATAGYVIQPTLTTSSSTSLFYISTPICLNIANSTSIANAAVKTTPDVFGNAWSTSSSIITNVNAASGFFTIMANCSVGSPGMSPTNTGCLYQIFASYTGSQKSGYWAVYCATGYSAFGTTMFTTAQVTAGGANNLTQLAPNCLQGWYTVLCNFPTINTPPAGFTILNTQSAVSIGCNNCSTGYTLNNGTCILEIAACQPGQMLTSTTCAFAAQGYTLSLAGVPSNCSNTSYSCTGGCLNGTYLASNGSCLNGTAIPNCYYHNSTTFCNQCGAATVWGTGNTTFYATNLTMCTACIAGCAICNTTTTCLNCSAGYTLTLTNTCTITTYSVSQAKSSTSMLLGLAFLNMIFYYIL